MEADATYLRSYFGNPAAYNLRRLPRTGEEGKRRSRRRRIDAVLCGRCDNVSPCNACYAHVILGSERNCV